MQNGRHLVTIRGTKEGFVFELDDQHLLSEVIEELEQKLNEDDLYDTNGQRVSVVVKTGFRYINGKEKERLQQLIEQSDKFTIERFDSEVMAKKDVKMLIDTTSIKLENKIVRSGQVLDVTGDLLLIGDVNPGGEVRATGNVFILGKLNGIAHAGKNGDDEAVIVASYMNPTQLRIGKYFSRAPDYDSEGVYMECGYLDKEKEQILIDRLQVLPEIRNELRSIERRILYG